MKIYGGVKVYSSISNLGTKLRQLYVRGNSPLYALRTAVGVPQSQSRCHAEEEEKISCLCSEWNTDS
jgi:hypothetical protein